jgi:hypothetical protein
MRVAVRWVLAVAAFFVACCAWPSLSVAQISCQGTDCDGDGVNNFQDTCPSVPTVDACGNGCGAGQVCFGGCWEQCAPNGLACPAGFVAHIIVAQEDCACVPPDFEPPDPNTPPPTPAVSDSVVYGFRHIGCYAGLIPETANCIPVAVRPFAEPVRDSELAPTSTSLRAGFNYVGIYDKSKGGAAASLQQASVESVQNSIRDQQRFPQNSLFACMGSVEFASNGSVLRTSPVVYGFQIVASYVRAIQDAAKDAHSADPAIGPFADALGLITGTRSSPGRRTSSTTGSPLVFRRVLATQIAQTILSDYPSIVGTAGTWFDYSVWSSDSTLLTSARTSELPNSISQIAETLCVATELISRIGVPTPEALPKSPLARVSIADAPTTVGRVDASTLIRILGGGTPSSCFRTTTGSNALMFGQRPAGVYYARAPKLTRWKDYFQGVYRAESPDRYGDEVGLNGPLVYPRAVDEFARKHGGDRSIRSLSPPTRDLTERRRPPAPRHLATATPLFATAPIAILYSPFRPLDSAFTEVTGVPVSALEAIGHVYTPLLTRPTSTPTGELTRHQIDIAGPIFAEGRTGDRWFTWHLLASGAPDQIVTSVPSSADQSAAFDFKVVNRAFFSVHFLPSKFYPGGTQWLTNCPSTACSLSTAALAGNRIGTHSSNSCAGEWCVDRIPGQVPSLTSYDDRLKLCIDNYNVHEPEKHWIPVSTSRVPLAGLFGVPGEFPAVAEGRLASSDLVRAQVGRARLHEGLDTNWHFRAEQLAPGFDAVMGAQPREYCYGDLNIIGPVFEVPLNCSNELVERCGSDAREENGCNPWETNILDRWKDEIKQECFTVCEEEGDGCSEIPIVGGWINDLGGGDVCDTFECLTEVAAFIPRCLAAVSPAGIVKVLVDDALALANVVCLGIVGQPCDDSRMVIYRREAGPPHAVVETENNTGFGARSLGLGYTDDCGDFACDTGNYDHRNELRSELYEVPGTRGGTTQTSDLFVVATDRLAASGPFNVDRPPSERIWPFTYAPGIFTNNLGVWGRVLQVGGRVPRGSTPDSVPSIGVLPDGIRGAILDPNSAAPGAGFRIEFIGDLIVDCGHNPVKTEIHPPVAILMHTSTSIMNAKRYSVFGWHRKDLDRNSIVFDLWPSKRSAVGATLGATNLMPSSGTFDTRLSAPGGGEAGRLNCDPFPSEAPDRIRCVLQAASGSASDSEADCDDNRRMLPACASDIAGGLVELTWQ